MRILYITQELDPFTAITEVSAACKEMPHFVNDKKNEIRILMPKYGHINERRHRLHEVVRLSGMNIIVDDEDYPLIIKVTSLPGARIQVYFLDNEEFFKRKNAFTDEDGIAFEDNAERLVFFCKGALETVRKFGWPPDVIHCYGAFTSLVPLFVKKAYNTDPIFSYSKVVYSAYTESFGKSLNKRFCEIAAISDISKSDLDMFLENDDFNLTKGAASYADAVIFEEKEVSEIDLKDKILIENFSEEKKYADISELYKTLSES